MVFTLAASVLLAGERSFRGWDAAAFQARSSVLCNVLSFSF